MSDQRPGLDPRRLAGLMRAAIDRLELNPADRTVVTEAAAEVATLTQELADAAGVRDRVELVGDKRAADLAGADVVTNGGHLRPLGGGTVELMHPGAAIPLMYEAWELRAANVDLAACRRRGIRVAGTNERHPAVDVFSYLGPMAVRLLTDAGISVYSSRLLLLCDNLFRAHIEQGLAAAGADVQVRDELSAEPLAGCDAVLVALQPRRGPVLSERDVYRLSQSAPGTLLAQFWGDLPRGALRAAGVPVWPPDAPARGHMGILPSALGPELIVRLQATGLKLGEVLSREDGTLRDGDLDYLQLL